MKILITTVSFIFLAILCIAKEPTTYTTDACGDTYTGQIQITFTHDLVMYPLPYIGEYYNETSGDF